MTEVIMDICYVILVNYKGMSDTIECLSSLRAMTDKTYRAIVVDNASPDQSLSLFEDWRSTAPADFTIEVENASDNLAPPDGDPTVRLLRSPVNGGFAAGNNIGIRRALADPRCKYVWLLNNDTLVGPDTLALLKSDLEARPDIGILGGTLIYHHLTETVQTLGGSFDFRRADGSQIGFMGKLSSLPDRDSVERQIAYVSGASMFLRTSTLRALGEMHEDYFLYFEELDWSERLPAGMRLGWCPAATIVHKEGASIGTSSLRRPSDTSIYYFHSSRLLFYSRNRKSLLYAPIVRSLRTVVKYALALDFRACRVVLLAVADRALGRVRRGAIV